jgi:hypothetical protein
MGRGMAVYDWLLELTFWNGVLAIFVWPYYVGVWVSKILTSVS